MGIGMKSILTIIFILLGTLTYAQSQKTFEKVSDDLVKITTYTNGRIEQSGYYTILDGDLFKHGEWKIYSNGMVLSRAKFDVGKLIWVDTSDGRFTNEQIRVRKLERRVEQLEQMLITYKSE
jgi:antitoxin component YwqK of YwqJK toxin-antitoxin module